MKFPRTLLDFNTSTVYFLILPVFLIGFIIIYTPFEMQDLLSLRGSTFAFNVTIITCITLVTTVITRLLLSILRRAFVANWPRYLFAMFWELMAIVAFISLYLHLMDKVEFPTYFECFFKVLPKIVGILIFPYIILTLFFACRGFLEERESVQEDVGRIKFHDASHRLKFTVASSDILYIESRENYVIIYYTPNDRLKSFVLRTSMKSIEELCSKNGVVRCHRSYFVKVNRVKSLIRGKEGYMAVQMNDIEATEVPVGKKYYDTLTSLL